ncbi:hypothetical protein J3B01_005518 [Coemansia erecta]|nr:hypothetical protein J3B01_005518 [Coemansia erecta]
MKDGSMLKDCFTYKFRIYTLCELKEAMLEAGFNSVGVWIATKDEANNSDNDSSEEDGNKDEFGGFTEMNSAMEMPHSFNAYVVGVKLPRSK